MLLSTGAIAGAVIFRLYRSIRYPSASAGMAAALGGDARPRIGAGRTSTAAGAGYPLFFSAGSRVFWRILALAAVSRVLLYGAGYLSALIYIEPGGGILGSLAALWQRSDAPHYLAIVENGYVSTGEDDVFLVFLPFYPLLVKLFTFIFQDALFAGLFVSQISFLAVCVLVYEVALLAGQDEDTAFMAAVYAMFFPASFFVNGTFSESLFLLLSALFFHCLLREKWLPAACFGLFAAFTRYYGALLAVPYAVEAAQRCSAAWAGGPQAKGTETECAGADGKSANGSGRTGVKGAGKRMLLAAATPILLIPVGTGLFLAVNYAVSGDFFRFLVYQREHWQQEFVFFFDSMRTLASNAVYFDAPTRATLFIPEVIFIVLFIALLAYGVAAKLRLSMLAYLGIYFLLTVSASWLLSFERYIFGALPVFSLTAALSQRSRFAGALVNFVCLAGLFFLMFAYVGGRHVY